MQALLLLIGLAAFFIGAWWMRRGSTLTRNCRWRADHSAGAGRWRCAACGAECDLPRGREPRDCLRPRPTPQQ